jgi:hypothetical protein
MPPRSNTKMLGITAHFRRQDGKSVDPPVSTFDRSGYVYTGDASSVVLTSCREALEGNVDALFYAFTWCAAIKNGSYWYERRNSSVELSPEDRDYIEWLLEEYS